MRRALLMTAKHMRDAFDSEERVIDRKDGAARITEDMLHALILERADDHLGSGEFDGAVPGGGAGQ
jgi:hypothetical protein